MPHVAGPLSLLGRSCNDANHGHRQLSGSPFSPRITTRRARIRALSVRLLNVAPMGAPVAEQLSLPALDGAIEMSLRDTTFVVVDLETTGGRMTAR